MFYVVSFRKRKRNLGDIFHLSLSCADFLGSLVEPVVMLQGLITSRSGWVFGQILCCVMLAIMIYTLCASTWSLVLISIE